MILGICFFEKFFRLEKIKKNAPTQPNKNRIPNVFPQIKL